MRGPGFRTELWTRYLGPGRKQLLTDLVYQDRCGRRLVVPAGFPSDGASVPRLLWVLYPPFGEAYEAAAWLHDYLYARAELVRVDGPDGLRPITRGEADAYLYEACLACGYRASGAAVLRLGVRVGGWWPWRRYRRAAAIAAVDVAA